VISFNFGGYAAVEYCGGPSRVFKIGREDVHGEPDAVTHDLEEIFNSLNVRRLSRLGLAPEDLVALTGGT
jgi:hypothetical protein